MTYSFKRIVFFILLTTTISVFSQKEKESFVKQASFYHENDAFFAPKNEDDNYTAGLRIDLVMREFKFWQPFFRFNAENSKFYNHINFGFQSFTPRNIAAKEVLRDDRPYASYTFLSLGKTQLFKNTAFYSEFSIGALGLSLAEKAQEYIHQAKFINSDRPIPQGWGNQIENGGHLAINYKLDYLYAFNDLVSGNFVIPSVRASTNFGNYTTDIYLGAQLSFFNINYTSSALNFNEIVAFKNFKKNKTRFNLFIEPGLRWNIYNATLQGALFSDHSVYTVDRDKIRSLLFDMNLGVNLNIKDVLVLKYTLTRRTQEYSYGKSSHWWGGFGLGFRF